MKFQFRGIRLILSSDIYSGSKSGARLIVKTFDKQKPTTYEESIRNITSALNGMKIFKTKKLEKTITDIQLELIMSKCLLNSDQTEYFREWTRERGTSILSSLSGSHK